MKMVCSIAGLIFCVSLTYALPDCDTCLYGECDVRGVCKYGCVTGFADKYCRQPCQASCKGSSCRLNEEGLIVCSDGCEDGYCGLQCKSHCSWGCITCNRSTCKSCTRCRESRYGSHCQLSCFRSCPTHVCDSTGKCSDSCLEGLFGSNCSMKCGYNCKTCQKNSGECIQCQPGYYGNSCQYKCPACLPRAVGVHYLSQHGCLSCRNEEGDTTRCVFERVEVEEMKNQLQGVSSTLHALTVITGLITSASFFWAGYCIFSRLKRGRCLQKRHSSYHHEMVAMLKKENSDEDFYKYSLDTREPQKPQGNARSVNEEVALRRHQAHLRYQSPDRMWKEH